MALYRGNWVALYGGNSASTMGIIHTVAENGKKFQLNKKLIPVEVIMPITRNEGIVDG